MESSPLWSPSTPWIEQANMTLFMHWLHDKKGLEFDRYHDVWAWSTKQLETFWKYLTEYLKVDITPVSSSPLSSFKMPGVKWFEGSKVNYTRQLFKKYNDHHPAIIERTEIRETTHYTWSKLHKDVAALNGYLIEKGIQKGDRVVGFMPNVYETVVAFLAVASIGAIWSGCSPDFGSESVIERFKQIEPKLLIAADGYSYGGKQFDRTEIVSSIVEQIPSLEGVIAFHYIGKEFTTLNHLSFITDWDSAVAREDKSITYTEVEFNDPLWILYSSGTTGRPKAITQSQGGIIIEHLKYLTLHSDVKPGSRFFWYTTTGWMMWNFVMGSLLSGATAVLYDGSPGYPDLSVLWNFAEEINMETFGTSAAYIMACRKAGIMPGNKFDLSALRSIGSTGSPLPISGFEWVYKYVKKDLWLNSVSGGTDICSVFTGGVPILPVYPGEIQCRALGAAVQSYDENGNSIVEEVGEMVIEKPMPSMPIFFWNDPNYKRYTGSYFDLYPHVWRHGDWLKITSSGGAVISGRSDATLNRGGIRIGTAEIYGTVEKLDEVKDSLIVGIELEDGEYYLPMFIQLFDQNSLSGILIERIKNTLRKQFSPRHVPDEIIAIPEIPYTLSGKKMETPVKRFLAGGRLEDVVNLDAMRNPQSMNFFIEFRKAKSFFH
jgi:acetoacetyl-CoA synthetase